MPAFFAHSRGSVSRVDGQVQVGLLPFSVRLQDMDFGGLEDLNSRAIITQAGILENGNYQFLHTLDETIYVYVFGDRIGELRVAGICFSNLCQADGASSGMAQIINNYQRNKLSARGGPVLVNFGEITYKGFLTGMQLDVSDPDRNLGQWAFRFHTFPASRAVGQITTLIT